MWVSIVYEVDITSCSNFDVYIVNSDFIIYWTEKGRIKKYFYWERILFFVTTDGTNHKDINIVIIYVEFERKTTTVTFVICSKKTSKRRSLYIVFPKYFDTNRSVLRVNFNFMSILYVKCFRR